MRTEQSPRSPNVSGTVLFAMPLFMLMNMESVQRIISDLFPWESIDSGLHGTHDGCLKLYNHHRSRTYTAKV